MHPITQIQIRYQRGGTMITYLLEDHPHEHFVEHRISYIAAVKVVDSLTESEHYTNRLELNLIVDDMHTDDMRAEADYENQERREIWNEMYGED